MQRFKKILVVIDPRTKDEALIDRAVTLSQRNNASLMVAMVVEESPSDSPKTRPLDRTKIERPRFDIIEDLPAGTSKSAVSDQPDILETYDARPETGFFEQDFKTEWESPMVFQEQIHQAEDRYLEKVIASLQELGIQAGGKTLYGTPFIEIIREVLRDKYDLVMITAEGGSGLKDMLFGGTTMHLMRKCPCPVWVMNAAQPKHYSHILAAVDPKPYDQERSELNIKIMDLATSLAQREQSELIVAHTWTVPYERHIQSGRVKIPKTTYDECVENVKDERRHSLNALLGRYDLEKLNSRVYLLKGEAQKLIPELAMAAEVELIVMGTVCRTGLAGILIGNTAEKILRQVDCSVLTVKPDGFITPVTLETHADR
jgi:nucleotide-binding universal stress UspA family protein